MSNDTQPSITPEQGQALADAIGAAVIKAGLIRPDALLTGPHLLQFVDDLATAHLATVAALETSRQTVDYLLAYGEKKFGDEFWPGNAAPWLGETEGSHLEQLLEQHEGFDLRAPELVATAAAAAIASQMEDDPAAEAISSEHIFAAMTDLDIPHLYENEVERVAEPRWSDHLKAQA